MIGRISENKIGNLLTELRKKGKIVNKRVTNMPKLVIS